MLRLVAFLTISAFLWAEDKPATETAPPNPPPAAAVSTGDKPKCPGQDDEPAMAVPTEAGPTLVVCGFEDHEVVSPTGKRAFSDFVVYYVTATNKEPQKLFNSEIAETFWLRGNTGKGVEMEEVWFFSEQPKPALWREITCEAESCKVSDAKCVFQMKSNPFPKALADFEKKRKNPKKLEEDGEELLDQIWAQALLGDKGAQTFYQGEATGFDENLTEVFASNKKKLADLKTLNCH